MIISRIIQGFGAGAVIPTTFAIIADTFAYEKRAKVMALNNTSWGISALTGPLIGGYIVDQLNWHWVFLINVPLGMIVLAVILFGYHEEKVEKKRIIIDFKGIITLSIFLVSLLMMFQELGNPLINWILETVLLFLTLSSLHLFIKAEKSSADPIIPLKTFSNLTFTLQILTALLLSGAQIGFQVYFPIWLQSIYRVSAAVAGLAITPSPIMWLGVSFFVGRMLKKWAPKYLIVVSATIQTICYSIILLAGVSFPMFMFYVISGLTGMGLGISITTNMVISQRLMEPDVGVASSMITLGKTLGQAIMTGIYGLIFSFSLNEQIKSHGSISFESVNQFINSNAQMTFTASTKQDLTSIVLNALHSVFLSVLLAFILVLVLNIFDKQRQPVK